MKAFIAITTYQDIPPIVKVTQKIYRVKNNIPTFLGIQSFNIENIKSIEDEAFKWLVKKDFLPKTYVYKEKYNGKLFKLIIL